VFGLTEAGARDGTFGTDGRAPVPGGPYQTCSDFAVAADGAIVLGGRGGFLARLLPSGAPDPAFATDVLPDRLTAVSAIRFGSGGRIFVAGNEPGGLGAATVVRLLADGTLDTLFGTGGTTQFVMKSYTPLPLELKDMKVIAGNALVLGGGTAFYGTGGFVVRLLGDDAGSGPGIVTVGDSSTFVTEADGQATVRVRRIGGTAGTVTVNYATQSPGGYDAVAGQDYTPVTGSLSWNDGESDDREITVPILADAAAEGQEMFQMVLESVEGGAGFGAKAGDIFIAGASYPNGSVSFEAVGMVTEGASAQVYVGRNDYCVGAVSVTVHLAGGTAEPGVDFNAQNGIGWSDVTLTWADGQCGTQSIYITTLADKTKEQDETMRLELVSPTGGAQLGVPAQTSVTIRDPIPLNRGGGGALGSLGAALLGLLATLRGRRGRAPAA
jgi:hypothetical protein